GCGRGVPGKIPEDAYTGRSAVLREILFCAGGFGIFEFRYEVRADRGADLLGPVVSGGFTDHGDARGASDFLPDEHWMAPAREGGVRGGAIGCLADDTTSACGGEWGLCGGGEPRGVRGEAGERRCGAGVLGEFVCGGPVWGGGGRGVAGEGRDIGDGV